MKNNVVLVVCLLFFSFSFTRESTFSSTFEIRPVYDGALVEPGKYYKLGKNDSIKLDLLKFYFTNITLLRGQKILFSDSSAHLADLSNLESMKVLVPYNGPADELRFDLGLDSTINTSGALGGDLDPTKGMYWAWQSGYVNFKVEGKSSASSDKSKHFSYHLGGYIFPNRNARTISLKVQSSSAYTVRIDLRKFFELCNLAEKSQVMSPGENAQKLTDVLVSCMSIIP